MKSSINRLILILLLTTGVSTAELASHVKWSKWLPDKSELKGTIDNETVASLSSENKDGLSETQFVMVKGRPVASVSTKMGKIKGEYLHVIVIDKHSEYAVNIEAGERDGVTVVTLLDGDRLVRVFFTDKRMKFVGINL